MEKHVAVKVRSHRRYGNCSGTGAGKTLAASESKVGLNAFKEGKLDVLIGSNAVGTGVDGLQDCCIQLNDRVV